MCPKLTELLSWNGPTVHVCCFMLARASTKTFVSRVQKTSEKIFVSRKIRQQGHSLAEVSLYPPQPPILEYPQPTFHPQCERQCFAPIQNNMQNYSSVYLNLCIVVQETGRQNILHQVIGTDIDVRIQHIILYCIIYCTNCNLIVFSRKFTTISILIICLNPKRKVEANVTENSQRMA